jgi:hypothetical protein
MNLRARAYQVQGFKARNSIWAKSCPARSSRREGESSAPPSMVRPSPSPHFEERAGERRPLKHAIQEKVSICIRAALGTPPREPSGVSLSPPGERASLLRGKKLGRPRHEDSAKGLCSPPYR